MVLTMIPGILAGVESANIDYDAVAYRTSVILCEDPGWPAKDDYSSKLASVDYSWEHYDDKHKDEIERLGLSVSALTPNILSKEKVEKFFNNHINLTLSEDDYRSKAIFGEIPYYYNISLKIESDPTNVTGSIAPEFEYGYMRRLVKLKEPGYARIDSANYNITHTNITFENPHVYTGFSIDFDYNDLQNNRSIGEEYRFRPESEPVSITLHNFKDSLNVSDVTSVMLTDVWFRNAEGNPIPGFSGEFKNSSFRFYLDDIQTGIQTSVDIRDTEEIKMELFPPIYSTLKESSQTDFSLVYNMTYTYLPDENMEHYYISGDIPFGYGYDYVIEPYLRDGVMEVLIW